MLDDSEKKVRNAFRLESLTQVSWIRCQNAWLTSCNCWNSRQPFQFPIGMPPLAEVEVLAHQVQRHHPQHELLVAGERQVLHGHRPQRRQQRTGAAGHDQADQRAQSFLQARLLDVLALRRAHADAGLAERRQVAEILDHPMQVDRRRTMAVAFAIERAVAAAIVFQARPARRCGSRLRVVVPLQLDAIVELMLVVQRDAVLDCHGLILSRETAGPSMTPARGTDGGLHPPPARPARIIEMSRYHIDAAHFFEMDQSSSSAQRSSKASSSCCNASSRARVSRCSSCGRR